MRKDDPRQGHRMTTKKGSNIERFKYRNSLLLHSRYNNRVSGMHGLYINDMKQFIITKKIAKHGSQSLIVIPKVLQDQLKPKTLVKITIDVLSEE